MRVSPAQILPSQNFLKPDTIAYILKCYREKRLEGLPPDPIVRKDNNGNLIAIDGHNLIAVKLHKGEDIDIHLAEHTEDGLPPTSEANIQRNRDLLDKYDSALEERAAAKADGIGTFYDLIAQYPDMFAD